LPLEKERKYKGSIDGKYARGRSGEDNEKEIVSSQSRMKRRNDARRGLLGHATQ